jgi:hypothetical protein
MIPICGALSYLISDFSYFVYFGNFDANRLSNTLRNTDLINLFYMLAFGPAITLTWLIGLLSGAIFYIFIRCYRKFGDYNNSP